MKVFKIWLILLLVFCLAGVYKLICSVRRILNDRIAGRRA